MSKVDFCFSIETETKRALEQIVREQNELRNTSLSVDSYIESLILADIHKYLCGEKTYK